MDEKGSKSEDHTMMIYKVLREILVDRESALEIARILLRARYGADELARQEPLSISETNEYWDILGSGVPDFQGILPGDLARGRAEIEMSKFDGRLWKFVITGHFSPH